MEDHVHKWEWIYRPDGMGARWIGCQCGEPMRSDQQMLRIQATERLSSKDARYYGELSGITLIRDAMIAYADTLDGR